MATGLVALNMMAGVARNLVIGLTGPGRLTLQNGGQINITGINGLIVGFGGADRTHSP